MRLLLDTNVLLDYVLRREPFASPARSVYTMGWFRDAELWASAKSFTDIFYFAERAVGSKRAQELMARLAGGLSLCSVDGDDIARALAERWDDFEDCLVYQAARKVKADYIIPRDKSGFERSKIEALSPAELVVRVERELRISYAEIDP